MTNKKVAFLVLSCDKYSDLWDPYAYLFNKYWTDCPFDKYFASNNIPFDKYGFQPVLIGEDTTWSQGLIRVLNKLKEKYDYVLITLEDLFLIQNIETKKFSNTVKIFMENNGNYMRLYNIKRATKPFNSCLSIIKKNSPYYQTCVYSLWNIKILEAILDVNENAWEFEKKGAKRCYPYDGFFCSNENYFKFSNTVVKGKWVRSELKRIKSIYPEIAIDRAVNDFTDELRAKIKGILFSAFFKLIPHKLQNKILICFQKW
jgi:hypothetical protein